VLGPASIREFTAPDVTLYWGDALVALENHIPDGSVDLIFVDPPYNIGKKFGRSNDRWPSEQAYVEWCKLWITLCCSKLTPTGSMYLMTATQHMPYLDIFLREQLHVLSRIVWHYDSSGVQAKAFYGSAYEPILYAVADKDRYTFNADDILVEAKTGAKRQLIDYRKDPPEPYKTDKVPNNVWYYPRVRYRMPEYEEHPTQKPEALLERIVRASSNPGDVVLDPFSGTFTTAAVARKLGRRVVGIELEREYVKIGLRRLGVATNLDGEELLPPRKSFEARTKGGADAIQHSLIDE
jgi:adenine-specific DNA-methyltransferase